MWSVWAALLASSITVTGRLLTQTPMLMAHDAAMAYAGYAAGRVEGFACYQWKTQGFKADAPWMGKAGSHPSGFTSLLNCGARALDLRLTEGGPCADKGIGNICMHHAENKIEDQTFESELSTIVDWAQANPTELVLLKLVPDNKGAPAAIQRALNVHKIVSIPTCVEHGIEATWTIEFAKERARMPNGGMILATWAPAVADGQPAQDSCVDDNFVPSIGFNPKDAAASFDALWRYANETVSRTNRTAKLQELQLMWQSARTFEEYMKAYPLDALDKQPFKYGNLKSTQESGINMQVLSKLESLQLAPAFNLVKMNDICLHGLDVALLLRTNVTAEQQASCFAMCGGVNSQNTCHSHE